MTADLDLVGDTGRSTRQKWRDAAKRSFGPWPVDRIDDPSRSALARQGRALLSSPMNPIAWKKLEAGDPR